MTVAELAHELLLCPPGREVVIVPPITGGRPAATTRVVVGSVGPDRVVMIHTAVRAPLGATPAREGAAT